MSARRVLEIVLCLASVGIGNHAMAQDEELPDLEFLEYLGSWEESDEDWLLFAEGAAEKVADEGNKRESSVPDDEKSTELEDEG